MPTPDFDRVIPREDSDSFKWAHYRNTGALPFWVADMDFPIAPPIQAAIQERLAHPIFGYARAPDALPAAIQAHLQREYQWTIDPEWLVWLPGVVAGLSASCRAWGEPGDNVLTCPPIYHHFLMVAQQTGKALREVPLARNGADWTLDIDALGKAADAKSRLMLLCSPHNPVGRVFTRQELTDVCEIAARHDMIVISDEIHCELILDKSTYHIPTAKACPDHADRIVTLMSPSKTYNLSGMNCSFAIIQNPALRQQFIRACESAVPMVPAFSYVAALAAYRDGREWRDALLDYLRDNYHYLKSELDPLPGLELTPLQATYLAWIDASGLGLPNPHRFFLDAGVEFSAGREFGQGWEQFVRMNFACPRATLEQGVERIKAAVAEFPLSPGFC